MNETRTSEHAHAYLNIPTPTETATRYGSGRVLMDSVPSY
jgi:hypothetical protein